jgi:sec-independent protein translocase protein TatA
VGSIGMPELLIILIVVVVIFGGNKIPQLGKGLGEGIKNFKTALKDLKGSDEQASTEEAKESKKEG